MGMHASRSCLFLVCESVVAAGDNSAEESKVAIVKIESITEGIILEAELLLLGSARRLPLHFSSDPPEQALKLSLATKNHSIWIKTKPKNTHFSLASKEKIKQKARQE